MAARAATPAYRARKFFGRHRLGVAATGAVILSLALGLTMTRRQARETAEQRDLARTEATKSELVAGFLVDLFGAADPFAEQQEEPSLRQLLERAEERVGDELEEAPQARAELLAAIGKAYRGIGELTRAQGLINDSVEIYRGLASPDPEGFARVLIEAAVTVSRREFDPARALLGEALEALDAGDVEAPLLRAEALATLARLGDTPLDEKEQLFRRALALRRSVGDESSAEVADLVQNLGSVLETRGDLEESIRLKGEALDLIEAVLGSEHPMYFQVTNNLGHVLVLRGDLVQAERHYRKAVEGLEARLGQDHPGLANPYSNLGKVLLDLGRREEAATYVESAARIGSAEPSQSFSTAGRQINLATLRREQGRTAEALELYREARAFLAEHLPEGHAGVSRVDSLIAQVLRLRGRDREAVELLEQALAIQERSPPGDRGLAETRRHLGGMLCRRGEAERGGQLVRLGCGGLVDLETDPIRAAECGLERASCGLIADGTSHVALDSVEATFRETLPADHFLWARLASVQATRGRKGEP